ncbi:MAG: fumarate hydratase [Deltaproteobacteria bacterium]|nr:fumarate hydratase [Deltaproteobacteria bacterium]
MKTIFAGEIIENVKALCLSAAYNLEKDATDAIKAARAKEESPLGRDTLDQIITNISIARHESMPLCQDTGIAVFFVELGRDCRIDGSLEDAINEGVRQGYSEGYLRKSVCHPLTRKNTNDNTPAIIHVAVTSGDKLKIKIAPKGAGSENMSRLAMLKPAEGVEGVKKFVIDTISIAGGNPCPPIIVGVGIGGNFEKSAILSKKALLRPIGSVNPDNDLARLEDELLKAINALGIGPMGFGGTQTALAVHIESYPCHIASLPVAVNIQCHASRHKEVTF